MWARTPWRIVLQRRPAIALLRDVPADDIRDAVVDGREEPAPALCLRPEPRRVRSPEFVGPLGPDPAAVAPVSAGMTPPHRRQQSVRPSSASAHGSCPTWIPLAASRALVFRWPSPRNGLAFSTVRISSNSSLSPSAVFGPPLPGRSGLDLLPADLRPQRIHA